MEKKKTNQTQNPTLEKMVKFCDNSKNGATIAQSFQNAQSICVASA